MKLLEEIWSDVKYVRYIKKDINDNIIYSFNLNWFDNEPTHPNLNSVYVQPEYRNKGYFHELMQEAINESIKNGADKIYLSVYKNNTISEQYVKYGFKKYNSRFKNIDWYIKKIK